MNTVENKSLLWDTLVQTKGFKEGIDFDKTQALFESIVVEINVISASIPEKNNLFLEEFKRRIQYLEDPESIQYRKIAFEERLKQNQERYSTMPPPVKELEEIKQLLHLILTKLNSI